MLEGYLAFDCEWFLKEFFKIYFGQHILNTPK